MTIQQVRFQHQALQRFMRRDDNCELPGWPDGWMGADTVLLMTEAARAVFDAVIEVQEYTLREGMLAEA